MSNVINQQVNLYQKQFHPVREVMTFGHCASLIFAAIVVFSIIGGLKFKQLEDRKMEVVALDQEHKSLIAELSQLAIIKNKKRKSAVKEQDISKSQKSLRTRRELLSNLIADESGAVDGFSEYMVALARQHVQGSWITGLSILQGGSQISIAGRVLEPELAPVYLQKMSNEKVFSGKSFGVMELSRSEPEGGRESGVQEEGNEPINFIIRTSNDVVKVAEVRSGS